jgi:hypothetical protein
MPSTLSAVTRLFVVFSGLVVACVFSATAVAHKRPPLQHVTIFGDSVASALSWDPTAREVIEHGNRVTYELHPCGRLWTAGCLANGQPPSTLASVKALGHRIGPTVVILVGYNDNPHVYAAGIDKVLHAMHNRGVKQVLWLTLRPVYDGRNSTQYRLTNSVIRGASHRFSWMTVVPWGAYSRPHNNWFGSDGVHFTSAGAVQFAIYVHRTLKGYGLTGPKNPNRG